MSIDKSERSDAIHAEGAGVATVQSPTATSLAALLSRHVLRDGELVILLLKPSLWYILLSSLRFAAVVLVLVIATRVFDEQLPPLNRFAVVEAAVFLIAGRLMWALLQWTSRLYVLTDLRIVSITGVFTAQIFDCPLRKVARTRLTYSTRERCFALGSVEIIPGPDEIPVGLWQTISKPRQIHEQVVAAINKAKQGGCL
jgi:hypothetical protein